jgi:phosphatidylglycerophosphate synthase
MGIATFVIRERVLSYSLRIRSSSILYYYCNRQINIVLSLVVAYSKLIDSLKRHGRRLQDAVFDAPARFLFRRGVSPDIVSVVSMAFVFLSSLLVYWRNGYYLLALPAAVCFDMLDGTLSRMYGSRRAGVLFDYFSDRFSDSLLMLSFVASGMLGFYLALSLFFFYVVSTLLTRVLESRGIRAYVLSFRILMLVALLLRELHPAAVFWVSCVLLLNYLLVALSALPYALKEN